MCDYHERESDGGGFDALNDPHQHETHDLDECEDVNASQFDVAQVDVVGLVLDRHKNDQQTIVELEVCERRKTSQCFRSSST